MPEIPMTMFGPVPEGWMWGTATASHQIEGGNVNNDWWRLEHAPGSPAKESSGDACDSWNRWLEDLQLVQRMGLDAYRFSLEWSRIEPAEGEFSLVALEHYREMMVAAHEMGLKTSVTLHHFTTPLWAADAGGWADERMVAWFARYADIVVQHLGDHIDMAATFNEPNVVDAGGYYSGTFPPGITGDRAVYEAAQRTIVAAHERAREVLKAGPGEFPVGLTIALPDVIVHPDDDVESDGLRYDQWDADALVAFNPWARLDAYLETAKGDDYVGVQTYFEMHLDSRGETLEVPESWRRTQIGWSFTPEALGQSVRRAAEVTGVPVIVTENGIATEDDDDRIEYYSRSLAAVRAALDDGVDVRGFFAWSLLDNFEWLHGFGPKFGLHEVDLVTFARTPKPSAGWYARLVEDSRS
ncbi:glycoside hydrolase family 1 protein [Demequina activiva]|uniref:Beta-glucosidase n=1 Tax=Demequina activiva TaxID=1582364 RepID=A0A919Q2Z4_9MICO|nr:family 1 glycosylhydrolase [Demequina activiva]GIG53931.1 beta-glucosidase [Demequina activiva]